MCIIVVLWYDHIITMPDEIVGIWQRPKTFVSWLYIMNRYLATIGNAIFFALVFKKLPLEVSAHATDLFSASAYVSYCVEVCSKCRPNQPCIKISSFKQL